LGFVDAKRHGQAHILQHGVDCPKTVEKPVAFCDEKLDQDWFFILPRTSFCDKIDEKEPRDIRGGNGGIELHTQLFLAVWNPTVTGTHFLVMAVLLACMLLAVLVATVVLICKVIRARRRYARQNPKIVTEIP
jgi:hypothetical protein